MEYCYPTFQHSAHSNYSGKDLPNFRNEKRIRIFLLRIVHSVITRQNVNASKHCSDQNIYYKIVSFTILFQSCLRRAENPIQTMCICLPMDFGFSVAEWHTLAIKICLIVGRACDRAALSLYTCIKCKQWMRLIVRAFVEKARDESIDHRRRKMKILTFSSKHISFAQPIAFI